MTFELKTRLRTSIVLIFCLGVLTSACTAAEPPALTHLKVAVGQKAPDFALPAGNGMSVRLSSLTGHNVLLYFYRGSW